MEVAEPETGIVAEVVLGEEVFGGGSNDVDGGPVRAGLKMWGRGCKQQAPHC